MYIKILEEFRPLYKDSIGKIAKTHISFEVIRKTEHGYMVDVYGKEFTIPYHHSSEVLFQPYKIEPYYSQEEYDFYDIMGKYYESAMKQKGGKNEWTNSKRTL